MKQPQTVTKTKIVVRHVSKKNKVYKRTYSKRQEI